MNHLSPPLGRSVILASGIFFAGLPCLSMGYGLADAVQSSITHNPEVLAKLHQFQGAQDDIDVAKADYWPTVDINYSSNHQKFHYPNTPGAPISQNYTTKGWTLNITQNLFHGLQTYHQVRELDNTRQATYFDFLAQSESMAQQTVQAYADVLRYRQLVMLAKDNYAVHKDIMGHLVDKEKAGVGRRVDLEQSAGRLALAQTNLITDNSNLHDVSARFRRLTGIEPPAQLDDIPALSSAQPEAPNLIRAGIEHSPSWLSALASLRAARDEVKVRKGAFSPTLDLQASKAPNTDNYDGYLGKTSQQSVNLIFNMNLFRGGADKARLGAAAQKFNEALDQRDRVCRDMRQTLSIANNNVLKLQEQMTSLQQHQLSTEKARDAYRKQFEIGQRTLLDVLDSENELFDAQRAYINAQADKTIAQATVLSNTGHLLETLSLKPVDTESMNTPLSEDDRTACNSEYEPPAALDIQSIPAHDFGNAPGNTDAVQPSPGKG